MYFYQEQTDDTKENTNKGKGAPVPGDMPPEGPNDPKDPRKDRKWQEWTKNAEGKWVHPEAKDFEGIPNRPTTQDPKLQRIYDELWRPKSEIPGGTAQILREEVKVGQLNPQHLQKAENRLTELLGRIKQSDKGEIPLSKLERDTADRVANDLKDAISKYRNIKR